VNECDIKHEERLRRYRLRVVYHPEWGRAVVHAGGVGRDVPGVCATLPYADWMRDRKAVSARLLDQAERILPSLPEPAGDTPWALREVAMAPLWILWMVAIVLLALPRMAFAWIWRR
jgi:hypothetical protein